VLVTYLDVCTDAVEDESCGTERSGSRRDCSSSRSMSSSVCTIVGQSVDCLSRAEGLAVFVATIVARKIWEDRDVVSSEFFTPAQAALAAVEFEQDEVARSGCQASADQRCQDSAGAGRSLVIADYADNPGGGGYGDATSLLRSMLRARVKCCAFGCLTDPSAARELARAFSEAVARGGGGGGALVERISIGGKTDARFGGGPVVVSGIVLRVSNGSFVGDGPMVCNQKQSLGVTAVLRVTALHDDGDDGDDDGAKEEEEDTKGKKIKTATTTLSSGSGAFDGCFDIIVSSNCLQVLDRQFFISQGIDLAAKCCIVVKSMVHFRAAFAPLARRVVLVDGGGLCSPAAYVPDLESTENPGKKREKVSRAQGGLDLNQPFVFTKARRPLYPLPETSG